MVWQWYFRTFNTINRGRSWCNLKIDAIYRRKKKRVKKRGCNLWTCSRILQPWYGLDWLVRLIIENLGGPLYIYSLSMWRKYHGQVARCVWPIKQTKPPPPPKKKKKKQKTRRGKMLRSQMAESDTQVATLTSYLEYACFASTTVLCLSLFYTICSITRPTEVYIKTNL